MHTNTHSGHLTADDNTDQVVKVIQWPYTYIHAYIHIQDAFTTDANTDWVVKVIPRPHLTGKYIDAENQRYPTIGIIPSGWGIVQDENDVSSSAGVGMFVFSMFCVSVYVCV